MTTLTRRQTLTADEAWLLVSYCRWKELAMRRHGFTSERMTRMAQKVASDALRLRGAVLQERLDDLVSRLVMVGMECAWRYDPEREHAHYGRNGGEPFASYVADVMDKRVDDYFRSKAEGFGDRRYGNDDRIVLFGDINEVLWQDGYAVEQTNFDFVLDIERSKWQRAAQATGQDLDTWMVNALNRAANVTLRDVA